MKNERKEEVIGQLIAVLFLLYVAKSQLGILDIPNDNHKLSFGNLNDYSGKYSYGSISYGSIGTPTGSMVMVYAPILPDFG